MSAISGSSPVWTPSRQRASGTNMSRFMAGHPDFDSLWRWSVEKPEEFWPAIWRYCGVKASRPYTSVVSRADNGWREQWFPGARLNFAENLRRYHDDAPALIAWNEEGQRQCISNHGLDHRISRFAQALKASGVKEGDCVASCLPNIPEAVIAMLAAASVGAVWTSCAAGSCAEEMLISFGPLSPKVLVGASRAYSGGKRLETWRTLSRVANALPGLKLTVVVTLGGHLPDLKSMPHALRWQDQVAFYVPQPLEYEQLPFDHPLCAYRTGTGEQPDYARHGAGAVLLQNLKDLILHTDLRPMDRVLLHGECGGLMWHWGLAAMATGACLVQYDGSVLSPSEDILWDIVSEERVSILGLGAGELSEMRRRKLEPGKSHDLSALRTLVCAGLPEEDVFDYVYSAVREDLHFACAWGDAALMSCYALGNPAAPVWRSELQARGLGNMVEIGEAGVRCRPAFSGQNLAPVPGADQARLTPRGGVTLAPGGSAI